MVGQFRQRADSPDIGWHLGGILSPRFRAEYCRHADSIRPGDILNVAIADIHARLRRASGQYAGVTEDVRMRFAEFERRTEDCEIKIRFDTKSLQFVPVRSLREDGIRDQSSSKTTRLDPL